MSSALHCYRNLVYTYSRRLRNVNQFCKVANTRAFTISRGRKSEPILSNEIHGAKRSLSSQSNAGNEPKRSYAPLMECPEVIWPSVFKTLRSWVTFKLLGMFLPPESSFDAIEFIDGSRQAVCIVSDALAREDYDSLEDLVTPEALEILRRNVSAMSDEQKKEIALKEEEYFLAFPSDITVRNVAGKSSKIVEVMMVYHFLRDWKDTQLYSKMTEQHSEFQRLELMNATVSNEEYIKHAIIGNYRFIREFGNGESSWSIDLVNQFRLCNVG